MTELTSPESRWAGLRVHEPRVHRQSMRRTGPVLDAAADEDLGIDDVARFEP